MLFTARFDSHAKKGDLVVQMHLLCDAFAIIAKEMEEAIVYAIANPTFCPCQTNVP